MSDHNGRPTLEERLAAQEQLLAANREQLKRIAEVVGVDAQPEDPQKQWRYNRSLLTRLSDLSDHFHQWNNTAHTLMGTIDKLARTVQASSEISRRNNESIQHVKELTERMERSSNMIAENTTLIANNLRVVVREKPLLMRDLFWLETNSIEVGLILFSLLEGMVFLRGADVLVRSNTYRSLAIFVDSPLFWGAAVCAMSAVTIVAFACRKRSWRMTAMGMQFFFFGTAGALTLINSPGAPGWVPHVLAGLGALWVMLRGPSDVPGD